MPTLPELKAKLEDLKNKGYVPSLRRGPTGIGHTFEYHLGLEETNLQVPDVGGRIELKAIRRNSGSLITLFTFNRDVWQSRQLDVVREFGYMDEKGRKNLYCSLWPKVENSLGFSIDVDRDGNILRLMRSGTTIASWSMYRLVACLLYKLGKILVVIADTRKNQEDREEFHFNEAYLISTPVEENFIAAIENSKVCLDLRMHINERGSVRNHGTAFRMKEKDLITLFKDRMELL